MQNAYAGHAAPSADGASSHSKSPFLYSFWVSSSPTNLWASLTRVQPFNSTQFRDSGEKPNPIEEPRASERVSQRRAREETSRLKGKSKERLTKKLTPKRSQPLEYVPTAPSTPHSATRYDDATDAHALQAKLDSERASYDLARQLQAQEDAMFLEHRRLIREAARVEVFDCVICMETYREDFSAPVRSCGHVLCRTCMREHVKSQVDQAIWPVPCPMCVADHSRTAEHGGEHGPVLLELC